jgi:hypothetical protein
VRRKLAICPTSQGWPTAARPIMTASAPDSRTMAAASSAEVQSPLTTTGTDTLCLTALTAAQSARPV